MTRKFDKTRRWSGRLILTLLIMFGIGYAALSMTERAKEPIRKGLEDYLNQASGQSAEITELAKLKLVPHVIFVMKGVIVHDKADPKKTLLKAEQVFIAKPFLHMFFGLTDYLGIEVKNMEVASGYWLPKKIILKTAGIVDDIEKDPKSVPNFLVDGTYNGAPLMLTAEMHRKISKYPIYRFGKITPVTFKIGELDGDGTLTRGFADVTFEAATIRHNDMGAEFIARHITMDPLSADFKGAIEEVPVNATLRKSGETVVLTIDPGSADDKAIAKIAKFTKALKQDFGFDEKAENFKIEIQKGAVKTAEEPDKK